MGREMGVEQFQWNLSAEACGVCCVSVMLEKGIPEVKWSPRQVPSLPRCSLESLLPVSASFPGSTEPLSILVRASQLLMHLLTAPDTAPFSHPA